MMEVQEVMARRRDRIIATILSFKERECDPFLPKDVQVKFRKVVLDQINDLHDLYCDMAKLNADEVTLNDLFLEKLEDIQETLRDMNGSK